VIHPGVSVTIGNNSYVHVFGKLQVNGTGEQSSWVKITTDTRAFLLETGSSAQFSYTRFNQVRSQVAEYVVTLQSCTAMFDHVVSNGYYIFSNYSSIDVSDSEFVNSTSVVLAFDSHLKFTNSHVNLNQIDKQHAFLVIRTFNGRVEICDNLINGSIEVYGCPILSISNNTIQYGMNGMYIVTDSCESSTIDISGNKILAAYSSGIFISILSSVDISIQNNHIYGLENTDSIHLEAAGNQGQSMITISSNQLNGRVIASCHGLYKMLLTNNTIDSVEEAFSVTTTGDVRITGNIIRRFTTAINMMNSRDNNLRIDNNIFEDGATVVSKLSLQVFTFSRNIVRRCQVVFVDVSAQTLCSLMHNVFDSNNCSGNKALVSFNGIVNEPLQMDISDNIFSNTTTGGKTIVLIETQPSTVAVEMTVMLNTFVDTDGLSIQLELGGVHEIQMMIERNIFDNTLASKDIAINGYKRSEHISAVYNYWGYNEWDKVLQRVNHPEFITQSPFFLTRNISDTSSNNIGYGPEPGVSSHQKEEKGLTGAEIGLIILAGVLVVTLIIGVTVLAVLYFRRQQTRSYQPVA
jgi:hypothetical protein